MYYGGLCTVYRKEEGREGKGRERKGKERKRREERESVCMYD